MQRLLGILVLALVVPLALAAPAGAQRSRPLTWHERDTPSTESLRGLDAVDRKTAWVAGDDGGVWRTTNGGKSWRNVAPAAAVPDGLAFRDVEAFSKKSAVVLAIGEGQLSRIYRTNDGGRSWRLSFVNDDPAAFYDCMDFYADGRRGLAMSDPVGGKFRILSTKDGGRHWRVLSSKGMPAAVDGEFGFAASGTCLETAGKHDAWIASGGAASRVFHSRDGGRHWTATASPIPAAEAGGVFSLAFRDKKHGVAVGGDFSKEADGVDKASYTRNGGRSYVGGIDVSGYRSGADWVVGSKKRLIAVGPNGSDTSFDGGRSWQRFSDVGFHSVVCVAGGTCWASGSGGRVARLTLRR